MREQKRFEKKVDPWSATWDASRTEVSESALDLFNPLCSVGGGSTGIDRSYDSVEELIIWANLQAIMTRGCVRSAEPVSQPILLLLCLLPRSKPSKRVDSPSRVDSRDDRICGLRIVEKVVIESA
jgi:hypothetical protein